MHVVEITINIVTHDPDHLTAPPNTPGPVVANKIVKFWAAGRRLQEVIADAHQRATAYLESEAVGVGTVPTAQTKGLLHSIIGGGKKDIQ